MEFSALDNRLVFLNLGALIELRLISDNVDGTPFRVSTETYRALTAHTPEDQIGPLIADERQKLVQQLAPDQSDPEKALELAELQMKTLRVIFADGKEETYVLEEATATSIAILANNLAEVGLNAFLAVDEEGEEVLKFVNLSNVAAIEVPLEAYLDHLADDFDDEDSQHRRAQTNT
jgi:hypothetical protein